MKYLKKYEGFFGNLFKSFSTHPNDKPKINQAELMNLYSLCREYNITNFTINDDLSISVNGDVNLSSKKLEKIPLQFRKVTGDFVCSNNRLLNLEGCPTEIGGDFRCDGNQLTSLEGCPKNINTVFDCSFNQLTSLEGCPKSVGKFFICTHNQIWTFRGIERVKDNLFCSKNPIAAIWGLYSVKYNGSYYNNLDFLDVVNTHETLFPRPNLVDSDTLEQIAEDLKVQLPEGWEEQLEAAGYQIL